MARSNTAKGRANATSPEGSPRPEAPTTAPVELPDEDSAPPLAVPIRPLGFLHRHLAVIAADGLQDLFDAEASLGLAEEALCDEGATREAALEDLHEGKRALRRVAMSFRDLGNLLTGQPFLDSPAAHLLALHNLLTSLREPARTPNPEETQRRAAEAFSDDPRPGPERTADPTPSEPPSEARPPSSPPSAVAPLGALHQRLSFLMLDALEQHALVERPLARVEATSRDDLHAELRQDLHEGLQQLRYLAATLCELSHVLTGEGERSPVLQVAALTELVGVLREPTHAARRAELVRRLAARAFSDAEADAAA